MEGAVVEEVLDSSKGGVSNPHTCWLVIPSCGAESNTPSKLRELS